LLEFWLAALTTPTSHFELSLLGLAGRLRIPAGWQVRLDPLDRHLFYYVAEGTFEARLDGQFRRINTGDVLWSMRGSPTEFRLAGGDSLVLWRFRLEALGPDGDPLPSPADYWHLPSAQSCAPWISQIVDEANCTEPWSEPRLRGFLLCLFTEMFRLENRPTNAGTLTLAQRETIARYFAAHAAGRPTPADLAAAIELSPDYFTRCFRRTYGVSPRQWLVQERMRLAAVHLLESHLRIVEVARELGHEDVFLFSRQFKSVFGVSPLQYRRQHGGVAPFSP
jgi:AraC-like DNA-binding protein